MELPHLGRNCAFLICNRLDYLPFKCDGCSEWFCSDHFAHANHDCPAPSPKDVRIPACPLCGAPVPVPRGEHPDIAVAEHIENQCQSDPAKEPRQKVYTNRCSYNGCKAKEMMPVVCNECELNFCLQHRHAADHACGGALAAKRCNAAPDQGPTKATVDDPKPSTSTSDSGDHANESPAEAIRRRAAEAAMARLQSGQAKKIEFRTRIASNPGRARVATLRDVQWNRTRDETLTTALSRTLETAALGGSDVAIASSLARHVGAQVKSTSWAQSRSYRPRRYSTGDSRGHGPELNYYDIFKVVGGIILTLCVLAGLKHMFNGTESSKAESDIYDMYEY